MVDDPPAVIDPGLNDAVAFAVRPLTVKETGCAEPEVTVVVIVDVPDAFGERARLVGLAAIEKSFVVVDVLQLGSLNDPICVLQLNVPLAGRYSLAYQKVQPSVGSIDMLL